MSYLIRRVVAKPRLILDEMCRLYGKLVLCKTRLIFPRINGLNVTEQFIATSLFVNKIKMIGMVLNVLRRQVHHKNF